MFRNSPGKSGCGCRQPAGFTLIELLVTIVIIAILAGIAAPSFKGLGQGNLTLSANRQIMGDIELARLRAVAERTTVFMVFAPPASDALRTHLNGLTPNQRTVLTNLFGGQYSSYALFSFRSVGDQPGAVNPRYLTPWKTLPEGIVIPDFKYRPVAAGSTNEYLLPFPVRRFPFPTALSPDYGPLAYLAFNSQGQMVQWDSTTGAPVSRDHVVPLARGSILVPRDKNGQVRLELPPDVLVTPKDNYTNNFIRISWLTGRATLETPQIR